MKSTLFTNVKLKGQDGLQDLYIVDGKFKEIGPGLAAKVKADKVVDMEGKLAVPPYVDPHIHLDYVFTALNPAAANKTGSLFEGIQRWSETKGNLTKEEIKERFLEAKEVIGDNLALSPQCGFASVEEGNCIDEETQWKKIDLLISCKDFI